MSLLCQTLWTAGKISNACGLQIVKEGRPHHVLGRQRTRFQRRFLENNFKSLPKRVQTEALEKQLEKDGQGEGGGETEQR